MFRGPELKSLIRNSVVLLYKKEVAGMCFIKKCLKNYVKFKGKHLCRSL